MLRDLVNTFRSKPTTLTTTQALFFNCKFQSENANWHKSGLVGTDFRAKQTLQVLHVWMVHTKLLTLGHRGSVLDEALYDFLWEETSNRMRYVGVGEMSINKYLEEVQGYSLRCCVELDEALSHAPDETEVVGRLGGVVWRFLFNKDEQVADEHIMQFARYIRREQLSMMSLPAAAVLEGRVAFDEMPFVQAEDKERDEQVARNGEWLEYLDMNGRPYYWNTLTLQSRWSKPDVKLTTNV